MKQIRKPFFVVGLFVVLFAILPVVSRAQGPNDDGATDPDAPIDGGVSLLVAAGIGYGIKKARNSRKNKIINL